jgi:hypothetical protein
MKNSVICRENGELKITFTSNKKQSMLELENEIESLIESAKDELSEIEKLQIKRQILQAYNNRE